MDAWKLPRPVVPDAAHWPPPGPSATVDVDAAAPFGGELEDDAPLDTERLLPTGFVEWFVVAQTAIPALLYLPNSQAYRLPVRIAAYAVPLAGFLLWWFNRWGVEKPKHPSERWIGLIVVLLAVSIFHPLTSSVTAGIAQTLLYFAIFCSVLWAPAFVDRPRQLVRILAILLVCNGINSIVGVLQVYDPARFMPAELSFAYGRNSTALAVASYIGPGGQRIIRPPGLFDTPGAVCGPGTVAALLGLVFALQPLAWWKRAGSLAFSLAGVSAIYLSYVRANLVVTVAMMTIYGVMLLLHGERKHATAFLALCAGVVVSGFLAMVVLGGESIRDRFTTLISEDPREVYYTARGQQLATGFSELADTYPLGAGLARWGMMRGYFGDPSNLDSTALWAEVQPNAWMLDGGLPLVLLYSLALIVTTVYEWRLVARLQGEQRLWAATVAAVNIGTLALVFSFVPFTTQVGLQFWFLEGVLHGALGRRSDP
jgi:hypothetical protein